MSQTETQIARLELRLKQLRARQAQAASRRRHMINEQERRNETRRKILVGAVVLAKVKQGEIEELKLQEWLNASLTRRDDRALFRL
jgi:hypothetical protein